MELTMKRERVECCEKVFEYCAPAEEAAETVIPDTMPDVERVLCAGGTAIIRSKEVQEGRVSLTAGVAATVIYTPEGEEGTRCVSAAVPFSISLEAPGVTAGSAAVCMLSVTGIEARILNPRKLLIRAVLSVHVECYERRELETVCGVDCGGERQIESLVETCAVSPVVVVKEKTFTLTDEYRFDGLPPAGELLWHSVVIVPGSVRNVGSKLVFGGTVRLAVLYAAEDTGELCSAAFETEFSQMLDTERELTSPDAAVYTLLTAEYIDLTTLAGGEKGISAEYHLVSQAVICDSARLNVLSDCYCNSRELVCETQELPFVCERRRRLLRAEARETVQASPPCAEVLKVFVRPGEPESQDGAAACPVSVTVLYRSAEGAVCAASARMTATVKAELPEGERIAALRAVSSEGFATPAQGALEVRAAVDIELTAERCSSAGAITSVTDAGEADTAGRPSVTVVRAAAGDTLWALGKKYHSTPELIAAVNSLGDGAPAEGSVLLIPAVK